ncbi:MAG: ribonuclease H-like domain-containing protein, partial [Planctomycetes bacterium]|nr:ribonuclease H-like domain-containing protein [Planctomycetota bacterium]
HRGVYENSRLQTMEKALCGLKRSDDLPGSLAPEAWFDYLGERPHRLEGVFRHNCDDVLSLVTLLAWLAEVDQRVHGQDSLKEESARELALCEALAGNKDFDMALLRLEPFIERFDSPAPIIGGPAGPNLELAALVLLRGECLRRLHRGQEAMDGLLPLLGMADASVWGARAKGLAAKVLERELSDVPAAHAMCLAAKKELAGLRTFQGRPALERDVAKRSARLAKKLAGMDPQPS